MILLVLVNIHLLIRCYLNREKCSRGKVKVFLCEENVKIIKYYFIHKKLMNLMSLSDIML